MNTTFSPKTAIIYDFIQSVIVKYNALNCIDKLKNFDLTRSPETTAAFDSIWDGIDNSTPGLALFFGKIYGETAYFGDRYNKKLIDFNSIDDLLDDFNKIPITDLIISVLKFFDSKNHGKAFYNKTLSDTNNLFEFVAQSCFSDIQKVELLGLIYSPNSILEPLNHLLYEMKSRLQAIYTKNLTLIDGFSKKLRDKLNNNPNSLLDPVRAFLNISKTTNSNKNIFITSSFLCEYSTIYVNTKKYSLFVLGIQYEDVLRVVGAKIDSKGNELFLKAFSDKHRIDIIRLLMNGEMYVGQIATACNLVMSTTSYHLEKLLNAGILDNRIVRKRVYYRLNSDFVDSKFHEIILAFQANVF